MTDPATPQSAPLRVLVVDPDDRIRETLAGLLCIDGQCTVVGTAGGADDAITVAVAMRPDVVLLDPRIPAPDGGQSMISCLREAAPGVRVLLLHWSDAAGDGPAGDADAYIKKTFRPHELIDAVVAAARTSVA
jgi:two-component system, NarL family, nitrate/nitrite response regulator NarL